MAVFLEAGLQPVAEGLDLQPQIVRGSSLALDPKLRRQERMIALVQALNGHTYGNAPSGRALYQADAFGRCGLELKFLIPYAGDQGRILPALVAGATETLRTRSVAKRNFSIGKQPFRSNVLPHKRLGCRALTSASAPVEKRS